MKRAQHKSKEQILTQSDPAKIRKSADAVVLKDGSVFFLTTPAGDVPFNLPHGFGLFLGDCRFLDGYTLTLNGTEPTVLSGIGARGFETHHHLTNAPLAGAAGGETLASNRIALHRQRLVRGGVVHELQTLTNHDRTPAALRLELRFRAKFEDLFIVKAFTAGPRGQVRPPQVMDRDAVHLSYDGRDGVVRTTEIAFSPPPSGLDGDRATYECTLQPGGRYEVAITITPSTGRPDEAARAHADPRTSPAILKRWLERSEEIWLARSANVRSSNPLFNRVLRRALLDLRLLRSKLDGLGYFAAGIPWFVTLFGRDAATVALQTLPYGADMARQTLRLLAHHQATAFDEYRDAAPGKILHELRTGELARVGAIPQSPAYYGTVDATLLFLILMAEYVRWSGDLALARELRPHLDLALAWTEEHADSDGDGYLDYRGRYANGLVNQGWKDSGNAIVNADGSLAEPPIALCEVQAYAYRAWRQTATLLRALDEPEAAGKLE
ncbi:MAG: amylo-alpha-1,6-glucosidase, partial [Candidatus Rokuibacteriota bacterium]